MNDIVSITKHGSVPVNTLQNAVASILECRGLERRFGGLVALTGVDLHIAQGEIFGLVGPNGSGKTTLTNAITGFFPPQKGKILLQGRDITGLAPHKVAALGVARTFQNLALFNGMSVLDNILLGRHIHMKPGVAKTCLYWWLGRKEEITHRVKAEEIIDFMQLQTVRDELVDSIPIGLKKRVELARALVSEPNFLILDEPMAGMNQEEKEYMARFILDARDERNVTVLLIEHHMDVITGICDRMMVLSYGETIGTGIPHEVIKDERVIKAYLGGTHAAR
ncbi:MULTISPECIES: ABC transporter ATP-binding protein [Noviherbaspirillum]|uniref:ABC transporter ATP-binding protein n=1 Tax=Noviherbaspirillum TaxID=1344552 RepID=UPI001CEF8934|nr:MULTISPECIES: ABC transporter ATP-binding protein [Noviherbaspirillum]